MILSDVYGQLASGDELASSSSPVHLFIGPDKAGSTWVHRFVRWHPLMESSCDKDSRVFCDTLPAEKLNRWVADKTYGSRSVIEVDHEYLFSDNAWGNAARLPEGSKVFVGLRNPVNRAFSSYRFMQFQGRLDPEMSFEQALGCVGELVDHGSYGALLTMNNRDALAARVVMLPFGELQKDPVSYARRIERNVGVENVELADEIISPAMAARSSRSVRATRVARCSLGVMRYVGLGSLAHSVKMNTLVQKAFASSRSTSGAQLPWDYATAYDRFVDDVKHLESSFGIEAHSTWSQGLELQRIKGDVIV